MRSRNPFDAAHEVGAAQVRQFIDATLAAGQVPDDEALLHGDNAYVLVEFLANTYPKVPREAHERDVWIFLYDYYVSQGPFSGRAVGLAPRSTAMFFEFVASKTRVPEAEFIRAACRQEEFFRRRVAGWEAIVGASNAPASDPEDVDRAVSEWQDELSARMRPLGLVPDAALARGEEPWRIDMGPVEAAVFDAVCVVLARRARSAGRTGAGPDEVERLLVEEQDGFMRAPNRGLGRSPLAAVMEERRRPLEPMPPPDE